MRVLLQRSHCSATKPDGWSGAPGEGAYIRLLCDRIATSCNLIGIGVTIVDGDMLDHPEYHADYDAFGAPHYDANVYNGVGGAFWGRAAASATALKDDVLGSIFWRRFRSIPGAPPSHFERMNVNVTDYYAFRLTTANTPGFLAELGVGAPGAPDFQWLRDNVQTIADCWALSFAEFGGIAGPEYAVLGPSASFAAPVGTQDWAALYRDEAPKSGIRAEVAFAQALHETGNFTFPGDVPASYNNPCGLGATGGKGVGNQFPTKRAGVVAHLQHLLRYFTPDHTPYCAPLVDPRHGAHWGLANDLRQLTGHWAFPGIDANGVTYDSRILAKVIEITRIISEEDFMALLSPAEQEALRSLISNAPALNYVVHGIGEDKPKSAAGYPVGSYGHLTERVANLEAHAVATAPGTAPTPTPTPAPSPTSSGLPPLFPPGHGPQ